MVKLPAQEELMAINATSASTLIFRSWREMDREREADWSLCSGGRKEGRDGEWPRNLGTGEEEIKVQIEKTDGKLWDGVTTIGIRAKGLMREDESEKNKSEQLKIKWRWLRASEPFSFPFFPFWFHHSAMYTITIRVGTVPSKFPPLTYFQKS